MIQCPKKKLIEEIYAQQTRIIFELCKISPDLDIKKLTDEINHIIQEQESFAGIVSNAISSRVKKTHSQLVVFLLQHALALVFIAEDECKTWSEMRLENSIDSIIHIIRLAENPASHPLFTEAARRRDIARLGGEKRNKNNKPVKEEALKLLYINMPCTGWKDVSHAVQGIKKETYKFILDNRIHLTEANLPATLKKWIEITPSLSAALIETSAPAAD